MLNDHQQLEFGPSESTAPRKCQRATKKKDPGTCTHDATLIAELYSILTSRSQDREPTSHPAPPNFAHTTKPSSPPIPPHPPESPTPSHVLPQRISHLFGRYSASNGGCSAISADFDIIHPPHPDFYTVPHRTKAANLPMSPAYHQGRYFPFVGKFGPPALSHPVFARVGASPTDGQPYVLARSDFDRCSESSGAIQLSADRDICEQCASYGK